jgi:GNAT superfamily N-acetyltransferase
MLFPTFPIPSFNGVWPDQDSAAGALGGALAEVEAEGIHQALAAEGFGLPADLLAPLYMLELTGLDGFEVYLGRVEGRDVTTAVSYAVDADVGIFNVATPPEYRGRGYGAAITGHAPREGYAAGADLAYLQSSAIGESVYRRLGFREVVSYELLTRPAEVTATS